MLAGVPATARTIDIDDTATAIIEGGDGPPLLLLHGGIECGGAVWTPVLTGSPSTTRWSSPTSQASASRHPSPISTSTRSGAGSPRSSTSPPSSSAHRRRLLAHRQPRHPVRHPKDRGHQPARDQRRIRRGLPHAAPAAFTSSSASRSAPAPTMPSDRFALLDLDATRRRDPDWYAAFDAATALVRRGAGCRRSQLVARQTTVAWLRRPPIGGYGRGEVYSSMRITSDSGTTPS